MAHDLSGYNDKFLLCRDPGVRHQWSIIGYYRDGSGTTCRDFRCSRCTTVKTQTLSGYAKKNSYDYPDGYHISADERITYDDIINEEMSRGTVHPTKEAMDKVVKDKRRSR